MKFSSNPVFKWFFPDLAIQTESSDKQTGINWIGAFPFIFFHLCCFGVIWVGWSPFAVWFALVFYVVRMFGITAFYHRYFSHHAFKANRLLSFFFALLGTSAMQQGPLWWSAIHRHHHIYADTEKDIHSPKMKGFWWSHIGWILSREYKRTKTEYIKDWLEYPELVFLDKFAIFVPFAVALIIYLIGDFLFRFAPQAHTNGIQLLVWGFFISTVVCSHATFSINSIDHMFGSRRYNLPDTSRNNLIMAIITLGEGWHNNHHHYPVTARAGFFWWEIDVTFYTLVLMSWLHLVSDVRPLPNKFRNRDYV